MSSEFRKGEYFLLLSSRAIKVFKIGSQIQPSDFALYLAGSCFILIFCVLIYLLNAFSSRDTNFKLMTWVITFRWWSLCDKKWSDIVEDGIALVCTRLILINHNVDCIHDSRAQLKSHAFICRQYSELDISSVNKFPIAVANYIDHFLFQEKPRRTAEKTGQYWICWEFKLLCIYKSMNLDGILFCFCLFLIDSIKMEQLGTTNVRSQQNFDK